MVWDVIVVGGGGAALSAALAAAREGAKVLVLSKTTLGLGNSSAVSGGGFSLGTGGFPPGKHKENTLKTGRWVNDPVLVDVLVSESGPVWQCNIRIRRGEDGYPRCEKGSPVSLAGVQL